MRKFKYDSTIYLEPVPDDIANEIREVICFSKNRKITRNMKFDVDLLFDELDFIELLMNVEKDNMIRIPDDDDINASMTVGEFVEVVEESMLRKAGIREIK
jgi:acyl carrier protein